MARVLNNAVAGPSRVRNRASPDPEEEDEEGQRKPEIEAEDGWTTDTFRDIPIPKSTTTAGIVNRFLEKAKELLKRIEEGLEKTKLAAEMAEDASPDDSMLEKLEKMFQQSVIHKHLTKIKIDILDHLVMQLRQNQPLINPMETYKQEVKKREKEYLDKTPRQKFKKDEDYIAFRSAIWEVNNSGEACPPMSHWLERADGDVSDSDDEVEIGGQTQNYRCPLTLAPLVGAMTCQACGHSYSGGAITDLMNQAAKNNRRGAPVQTKCPLAGCQAVVTTTNLKNNPGLQRRADIFLQRQQRRNEEESEGDEE